MQLKSVVLPAPLGPMRPTISPRLDGERDVAVGDEAAEALGARLDAAATAPSRQPLAGAAGARPKPAAQRAHGSESSPLGRQPAISMMTAP